LHIAKLKCAISIALLLAVAVPPRLVGEQHRKPRPEPLELLVVGSGGPRSFGRACTSYLLLIDGTPRILVDAGPGAFLEMGKLGVDLDNVDIVLLTHLHIDHSGDIPGVFLDRALTADGPIQFKVFGPQSGDQFPSTTEFLKLLFGPRGVYEYEKTFGADETIDGKDLLTALDSPETEIVSEGDLRVREVATHHGDCPSVAYRVEYKGKSITFSGDMDQSALPNLTRLAAGSDLLVFHVGVLDPPGSPQILYTLHTPPKQIGQAAEQAKARRLLLSHISPSIEDNRRQVLRSIANSYKGNVDLAYDGMRVPVSEAGEANRKTAAAGNQK